MAATRQTYQNHARYVPAYHMVAGPILLINFLWCAYRAFTRAGPDSAVGLLLSIALIIMKAIKQLVRDWQADTLRA